MDEKGVELALGALAEHLQKSNTVMEKILRKAEEDEKEVEAKEEEKEEMEAKKAFVSDISNAVIASLTSAYPNVFKSEISDATKQASDGTKEQPKIATKQADPLDPAAGQQKPIQAATDGAEEKKEEEDEKEGKKEEYPAVENMRKQIADLQKQIESLEKSAVADVKKSVTDSMRRTGWREETGLVAPKRVELGADVVDIKKSAETQEDRVAAMAKYSYSDIKRLELQDQLGTLPPEISQLLKG